MLPSSTGENGTQGQGSLASEIMAAVRVALSSLQNPRWGFRELFARPGREQSSRDDLMGSCFALRASAVNLFHAVQLRACHTAIGN
jgi:hypothetical protein